MSIVRIPEKVLSLSLSLRGAEMPITRRVRVADSLSFYQLHRVIQVLMGWHDYHLYEFVFNRRLRVDCDMEGYEEHVEMYGAPVGEAVLPPDIALSTLVRTKGKRFKYHYDFGDSWLVDIRVTSIAERRKDDRNAFCVAGKNSGPPEDCGGVWGYAELLEIRKDKNHPLYEERIANWLGDDFNPEAFDIDAVNKKLSTCF